MNSIRDWMKIIWQHQLSNSESKPHPSWISPKCNCVFGQDLGAVLTLKLRPAGVQTCHKALWIGAYWARFFWCIIRGSLVSLHLWAHDLSKGVTAPMDTEAHKTIANSKRFLNTHNQKLIQNEIRNESEVTLAVFVHVTPHSSIAAMAPNTTYHRAVYTPSHHTKPRRMPKIHWFPLETKTSY